MIFNITSGKKWIYDQVTVTITGHTATGTYSGSAQSVSGYDVSINYPGYTTSDFTFSGTASASRTAAGTTNMGLTAAQFANTNPMYRNVVFQVTDGYVKVNQKAVTVTADNKSKTYGASDPTLTATITGRVSTSDTITYSLTRASGSNVGTYTITASGTASQGNYTVSFVNGTFTINKAAASALGLSVSGGTYTYNGTARSITASTSVTSGTTIYYSSNGSSGWTTTKPTLTNSGSMTTYVKAVNSNYNDATGNATVTINKAAASGLGLSVSGYSALYNGSAHGNTATVSVTSGTTIYYSSNGSSGWTTTKPTLTNVGSITTYVKATNANYNDATGNATVTNTCLVTVTTAASASVKFGSTTVTANTSGVATYYATASGSLSITSTKNGLSATGSVTVPTNSASASLALPIRTYLFKSGTGSVVPLTYYWSGSATAAVTGTTSFVVAYNSSTVGTRAVANSTINLSLYSKIGCDMYGTTEPWLFVNSITSAAMPSSYPDKTHVTTPAPNPRRTEVWDISHRTETWYVGIHCGSSNGVTVYNWYLEV